MTKLLKTLCLMAMASAALLISCSGNPSTDAGTTRKDGGGGGGGEAEAFTIYSLDDAARETVYFAMAVDPGTERVGVVYYTPNGTMQGGDGGTEKNYDLKYVEWNNGAASAPETLRSMQRMVGLSMAFDPNSHQPVAAFLGGEAGFIEGQSIYWYQNDTSVMRRAMPNVWVETRVATLSAPPACSPIDQGFLEGLWSSVVFDSTGKMYVSFRDGHNGQFPQQDWAASDVEVLEGAAESTSMMRTCLTGDHKQAYGGRIQLAIGAADQPAVVYDQAFGGADVTGQNVYFQQRKTDAGWTETTAVLTVSNTMTGASLAYDATEGYGIAFTDRANNQLKYIKSAAGTNWSVPDDVFGTGTGGWYPSLAMDPMFHEPAIAFYVCSPRTGINDTSCLQNDDELRVMQRVTPMGQAGTWRETVVDPAGGWAPKLKFFASGKRVVAYRVPSALDASAKVNPLAGQIKLAVEK